MKKISVISLNMWMGAYIKDVIEMVGRYQPDVLMFQEVTRGSDKDVPHGIANAYEQLESSLNSYRFEFMPMWKVVNKTVYEVGLAIGSKLPINHVSKRYYLDGVLEIDSAIGNTTFPGAYLAANCTVGNIDVWFATVHFVWSMHPVVSIRQIDAADILTKETSTLTPLILGGDFNVTDQSVVYEKIAREMTDDRVGTTNTLHKQIHKLKGSKDLAVDYLFHKGEQINLIESSVLDESVSDHLPVRAIYQIEGV